LDNFYIYYRIDPTQRTAMLAAVARHFAYMRAQGFEGRLMERPEDTDTWMEVFEAVADAAAFRRALSNAEHTSGVADLLPDGGRRHVEHFQQIKLA